MSASTGHPKKRLNVHERLAIEFHEHKFKYLKEEHEMKMKRTGDEDEGERGAASHQYINL
ncbi:hypothetical protein DPX16_8768 [Anabarilius grahami]|uniref:Uncharacterized protein n=1 Tax=Anabarilius grahami TaxID=495550 RepID=A0A3N0YDP5_ANAGA|nr:hypothetical protein DPX16_8768 [Anabarilius grahami]